MEHEANLLWINSDSSYNFHEAWLRENFRKNERGQVITVKSDNVLEPAVINKVNTVGLNRGTGAQQSYHGGDGDVGGDGGGSDGGPDGGGGGDGDGDGGGGQ